jgi:GTP1/Obg family GTP-binding protein
MLLELLYISLEHKLRRIVSSTSVQDLKRAAPATFRTQIEQIRNILSSLKKGQNKMEKLNSF